MNADLIKSTATFCVRLDGENEMDALLLAKTIHDMAELTKIIVKEEDSEAHAKINVTAFSEGSFQIDFSTVCETARTLLDIPSLALAIVKIIKGALEIKKHIGNKKPKSLIESGGGKVIVENEGGQKISVPSTSQVVINNVNIEHLIMNISSNAKEHNPSGGFTFSTESDKAVFSAADLKKMSKALPAEQITTCQRREFEAELIIKKADIRGRSSWEFYHIDKRIIANITDDEWIARLHNCEFKIGHGDSITAKIERYIDFDSMNNPIENSEKYTIVKVIGDIKSVPKQMTF